MIHWAENKTSDWKKSILLSLDLYSWYNLLGDKCILLALYLSTTLKLYCTTMVGRFGSWARGLHWRFMIYLTFALYHPFSVLLNLILLITCFVSSESDNIPHLCIFQIFAPFLWNCDENVWKFFFLRKYLGKLAKRSIFVLEGTLKTYVHNTYINVRLNQIISS